VKWSHARPVKRKKQKIATSSTTNPTSTEWSKLLCRQCLC